MRHPAQFLEPLFRIVTILVHPEAGRTERIVDDFSTGFCYNLANQMIVFRRQASYVVRPLELVQVHCARRVDVIRRQAARSHSVAVEEHQARPVLARVAGLLLVEELSFRRRLIVVLHDEHV